MNILEVEFCVLSRTTFHVSPDEYNAFYERLLLNKNVKDRTSGPSINVPFPPPPVVLENRHL